MSAKLVQPMELELWPRWNICTDFETYNTASV